MHMNLAQAALHKKHVSCFDARRALMGTNRTQLERQTNPRFRRARKSAKFTPIEIAHKGPGRSALAFLPGFTEFAGEL